MENPEAASMAVRRRTRATLFVLGAMLLLAPMAISSTARAESVFTSVRNAVADALDSSNETGGYTVGLLAIVVILLIVAVLMARVDQANPMFLGIASMAAIAFVILVGWWPTWTAIFVVFAFILMILGNRGGSD